MAVEIYLPPSLQNLTDGQRSVLIEGRSLGECLNKLIAVFPALQGSLFDAVGIFSRKMAILINNESHYPVVLNHQVRSGDKVYIMDILVGG
jgi:hypothetical protein